MAYHATASSALFASHVKRGLTTPGLKKVPTPGYDTGISRVQDDDRKFNRDGSKRVIGSETNLVVNNLFERITLVEQSVKLDNVRVLMSLHVRMAVGREGTKGGGPFRRID